MNQFDWREFLLGLSDDQRRDPQIAAKLPASLDTSWLGFDGASEQDLRALEGRLGSRLPPSYRAFLQTSNGWRNLGAFIDKLWSTSEVEWFSVRNQDWIDAYATTPEEDARIREVDYLKYGDDQNSALFPSRYLQTALEISDVGDSAVLLLNPKVVTPAGEWEAWFFANWLPGARRYRSFEELMIGERNAFNALLLNRGRPSPKPPGLMSSLFREIRDALRGEPSRPEC